MTFHEFCFRFNTTDKERYDLAHHLAALRYQRTILMTIGADIKPIKAALAGSL